MTHRPDFRIDFKCFDKIHTTYYGPLDSNPYLIEDENNSAIATTVENQGWYKRLILTGEGDIISEIKVTKLEDIQHE